MLDGAGKSSHSLRCSPDDSGGHAVHHNGIGRFERIAGRFGVPTAILVFIGLSGYASGRWIAVHIAEPMVARHMRFLDATEGMMREQADATKKWGNAMERVGDELEGIRVINVKNGEKLDTTHELLRANGVTMQQFVKVAEKQMGEQ